MSLIVEINGRIDATQVEVAAITVELFVYTDDAVRVAHPPLPVFITRTLQRVLRVVRQTLPLERLILSHRLWHTYTEVRLLRVFRCGIAFRYQSQQLALAAAVRLRFRQWYLLYVTHTLFVEK